MIISLPPHSGSRYRRKRKRGAIDYNAEIPFEKRPAPGFYDTSEDTLDIVPPNFKRMRQQTVMGTRRDDIERVSMSCDQDFIWWGKLPPPSTSKELHIKPLTKPVKDQFTSETHHKHLSDSKNKNNFLGQTSLVVTWCANMYASSNTLVVSNTL